MSIHIDLAKLKLTVLLLLLIAISYTGLTMLAPETLDAERVMNTVLFVIFITIFACLFVTWTSEPECETVSMKAEIELLQKTKGKISVIRSDLYNSGIRPSSLLEARSHLQDLYRELKQKTKSGTEGGLYENEVYLLNLKYTLDMWPTSTELNNLILGAFQELDRDIRTDIKYTFAEWDFGSMSTPCQIYWDLIYNTKDNGELNRQIQEIFERNHLTKDVHEWFKRVDQKEVEVFEMLFADLI